MVHATAHGGNYSEVERRHIRAYWQRIEEAKHANRIDNSRLHAGSPMFYYCRHCGIHTETLPEDHIQAPMTTCLSCHWLFDNGLLPPPTLEEIGEGRDRQASA